MLCFSGVLQHIRVSDWSATNAYFALHLWVSNEFHLAAKVYLLTPTALDTI